MPHSYEAWCFTVVLHLVRRGTTDVEARYGGQGRLLPLQQRKHARPPVATQQPPHGIHSRQLPPQHPPATRRPLPMGPNQI